MKVAGKNVVILIKVGLEYKLYACATSATLNVTTEVIETSVSGSGKFATFAPTKNSFTGTLEGVTTLEEDSMLSLKDLRGKQLNQDVLTVLFQRSAGTSTYTDKGDFIITGSSDTGSFDDMNTFSIEMQGTGPLIQTSLPSPDATPFDYQYGSTDLNAIYFPGVGVIALHESDFIQSFDDVISAGDEVTGTANNTGDNVRIEDFGGTGDMVRFLFMPDTEAAFTKWSEEGNLLQQNQPIDPSFQYANGNVWFKSARDGLYMTYGQTTFSGAIIFSR